MTCDYREKCNECDKKSDDEIRRCERRIEMDYQERVLGWKIR